MNTRFRRLRPVRPRLAACAGLVLAALAFTGTAPPAARAQQGDVVIVGNDRGGGVTRRAALIDRIRALRRPVEIRGPLCLSACTMYLGAGDVCVDPGVTFGFHGPSASGRPISRPSFEHYSRVMADHYPPGLRRWFIETARHRTSGYYRISGARLIEMGQKSC